MANRDNSSDTCVDHYILLLKHLSNDIHFITNGFERFFIDQLVRSKTTCSFKLGCFLIFIFFLKTKIVQHPLQLMPFSTVPLTSWQIQKKYCNFTASKKQEAILVINFPHLKPAHVQNQHSKAGVVSSYFEVPIILGNLRKKQRSVLLNNNHATIQQGTLAKLLSCERGFAEQLQVHHSCIVSKEIIQEHLAHKFFCTASSTRSTLYTYAGRIILGQEIKMLPGGRGEIFLLTMVI